MKKMKKKRANSPSRSTFTEIFVVFGSCRKNKHRLKNDFWTEKSEKKVIFCENLTPVGLINFMVKKRDFLGLLSFQGIKGNR